jgi:hypothetical protein
MPYQLPVLPPELAVAEGWAPRESFSPSQMQSYAAKDGCKRKWAWGSCFGVWGVRKTLSQLLGSLIHGSLEHYMNGGTVYDLLSPEKYPGQPIRERLRLDERTLKEFANIDNAKLVDLAEQAPRRALAGLHLLPNIQDPALEAKEIEQWIKIDTTKIIGGIQPLKISGKIDLAIRRAGVWYLYDHKSTKGQARDPWCYIKSPEDLRTDPQAIFYALDVMLKHGIDSLWLRWIYYLTDTKSHPLAKEVDVEFKLTDVLHAAYQWLLTANEMREWIRKALRRELSPYDVPANEAACDAYGGCNYHYTVGGPCMPAGEVKLGDIIIPGPEPEKATPMTLAAAPSALAQQLAQLQGQLGAAAGTQPPMVPPMPLVPPEAHGTVATAAAVAAAPAQPALPAGWHWGPDNKPRADAPAGYHYNAGGQLEVTPVAPPPAPPGYAYGPDGSLVPLAAPPAPPPALPVATAEAVPVPPQAAATGRKGRPKGSKNKAATAAAGEAAAGDDETSAYDVLVNAAHDAPEGSPLHTLTIAQLRAVAAVLDAA